jgi:SagB-type dehydrogenase family enzyme
MVAWSGVAGETTMKSPEMIALPAPAGSATEPLHQLMMQRRSVRSFGAAPLSLAQLGQLLWAAQGITHPEGLRTAPSAGALYPLELYAVVGAVDGLKPGVYHYRPDEHQLSKVADGDRREPLARAALGQSWIAEAAVVIAFAAIFERTTRKYGERGVRYVHMEVGYAGQNLHLQASALGLGTTVVGAFDDDEVSAVLGLPERTQPLTLMPVGYPAGDAATD